VLQSVGHLHLHNLNSITAIVKCEAWYLYLGLKQRTDTIIR